MSALEREPRPPCLYPPSPAAANPAQPSPSSAKVTMAASCGILMLVSGEGLATQSGTGGGKDGLEHSWNQLR